MVAHESLATLSGHQPTAEASFNAAAKLIWMRCQGCSGQNLWCRGDVVGALLTDWHD